MSLVPVSAAHDSLKVGFQLLSDHPGLQERGNVIRPHVLVTNLIDPRPSFRLYASFLFKSIDGAVIY